MATITEGLRIYNRGDVCNASHFGTVTKIIPAGRFGGAQVEITPDADGEREKPYTVPGVMIHDVDSGNGSTRIVTEAAHRAFYERQQAAFMRSIGK